LIFNSKYYKPPSVWNLRLRAAFGNPKGDCIEDGVVIDAETVKHIPPIMYNACITVEFTFKTVKQPKGSRFITINGCDGMLNDELMVGCLITEHAAYVKHSKHTNILRGKIGDHYFYLIIFLPKKTNMYNNLHVRHIYNSNVITVVITGQTSVKVDVGSKVANAFGQKNIISMVHDLRDCCGITRSGRKVHAQIIYSEVSLVGRVISGQLYDMFMSDELAIGDDGTIIAPIDLIIHTLHPYTNVKVFAVKNDTLTNINGFDTQNLCCTSQALRNNDVQNQIFQVLGLHGYDVEFLKSAGNNGPRIIDDHQFIKPTTLPNEDVNVEKIENSGLFTEVCVG
jgi:hypothetical protein